ncbi:MAG TPA: ATP-binding cassette domain-containing protein [Candidatus Binatia bacterium]|nr:ATP-binding cassette domain-containing protein [Candidatus Binatia bacterium]
MIRLEGASFAVRDASGQPKTLLHPTDLSLEPGARHLILGANGSGKSTLLRLMAGLAAPAAGRILLDGQPVAAGATLWPRVAVIFEEPDPQFLSDTVAGEIAFGLESMALAPAETRARAAQAMEEHGLTALAERDPRTLSAGEKTRALLAAALAARPSALLLDQCFAHLDPATRRAEEEWLAGMARAGGLAVLRASQDLDPPLPGERIHLLEAGRLHGLSAMTPASVLAAHRAPLPLALRASAALSVEGRWSGALAATAEEFLAALDRSEAGGLADSVARARPGAAVSHDPLAPEIPRRGAPLLSLAQVAWTPSRGAAYVVEEVSLDIAPGEAVALVGASGAGKSTLLHLAAGLREPSSGRVERALPTVKRVPPVMLALEYPERQLFARTVAEDAAAALWIEGVPADERARRAERALREVDLDPERFAERAPSTLSEGEKRRAALASFLIEPPLVLLWDEPTAGLDPEGRRALRTALARLRDRGRAILFASHDLDFVGAVADRVLVMGREPGGPGRLLGSGAPEAVWDDAPLLAQARLPVPEFHALARALRERGCLPSGRVRDGDALIAALSRSAAPLAW